LLIGLQRVAAQAHPLSHRTGILLVMHFTPHTATQRPCWHCTHFLALVYRDTAARCALPPGIRAMQEYGCALREREVGSHDEAGPPASADVARRHDRDRDVTTTARCGADTHRHRPHALTKA